MSKMEQIFSNEKLLEKVAGAKTQEEAKKACKEVGMELSDKDLEEIAGGLNKTAKTVLKVLGAVVTTTAAVATAWWLKKPKDVVEKGSELYSSDMIFGDDIPQM